ncbi:hypothetical protein JHK87_045140 [Glycine soja]|nr:hypothetical protein JHK87_045140 [Glycine soja]
MEAESRLDGSGDGGAMGTRRVPREGLWEIGKAVKCLEAICQSDVSFFPEVYNLLNQCYHLVEAIPPQKQVLHKGTELTASVGYDGCYVEGVHLRNRFQWKDTIGPWEERPGHLGEGDHSQLHHVSTMLGYHGDTSVTFYCGDVDDIAKKLVQLPHFVFMPPMAARPLLEEYAIEELIDLRLGNHYSEHEARPFLPSAITKDVFDLKLHDLA